MAGLHAVEVGDCVGEVLTYLRVCGDMGEGGMWPGCMLSK